MLKVKIYNSKGQETKDLKLDSKVFEVAVNSAVIHQVAVAMMANQRQVLAHTKDRGEVRGGGIKPWRQKGTGRARHGSIRSPLWIGGGVTFGPNSDRNFKQKINKKMRRKALFMALSDKVTDNQFKVIGAFEPADYKTKKFVELFKNLGLEKSVLVVNDKLDSKFVKSLANLPKVDSIEARNLNLLEVLKYQTILISEAAVGIIAKTFLEKKAEDKEVKAKPAKVKSRKKTTKKSAAKKVK